MIAHVRAADFPETHSRWLALGREAGFSDARAVHRSPGSLSNVLLPAFFLERQSRLAPTCPFYCVTPGHACDRAGMAIRNKPTGSGSIVTLR